MNDSIIDIASADPKCESMSKQERFAKVLIAAKTALDKAGKQFFLSDGTALGAYRDGKFIEYDDDIDLGIFSGDHDDIMCLEMTRHGFRLRSQSGSKGTASHRSFYYDQFDVRVDIVTYYEESDYYWHATFGRLCRCMENGYCAWGYIKFKLTPFVFLENEFLMPAPIEGYLACKYGPGWRTPVKYSYRMGVLGRYQNRVSKYTLSRIVKTIFGEFKKLAKKSLASKIFRR